MPVLSAYWEAEAGGSLEVRSSDQPGQQGETPSQKTKTPTHLNVYKTKTQRMKEKNRVHGYSLLRKVLMKL